MSVSPVVSSSDPIIVRRNFQVLQSAIKKLNDVVSALEIPVALADDDSSITTIADGPVTADELRDDLQTNVIPSIKSSIDALATKLNEVIEKLQLN